MKLKPDMNFDLKSLIRNRKHLKIKQGVLYRKINQVNNKTKLQPLIPREHRERAIEGCQDQICHLGNDRTLKLWRDRLYFPGMQTDVLSNTNTYPRCLRRKSQ